MIRYKNDIIECCFIGQYDKFDIYYKNNYIYVFYKDNKFAEGTFQSSKEHIKKLYYLYNREIKLKRIMKCAHKY